MLPTVTSDGGYTPAGFAKYREMCLRIVGEMTRAFLSPPRLLLPLLQYYKTTLHRCHCCCCCHARPLVELGSLLNSALIENANYQHSAMFQKTAKGLQDQHLVLDQAPKSPNPVKSHSQSPELACR